MEADAGHTQRRDRALVDLDLDAATATVLGKRAKRRTVPLTPAAVQALRAYLTWRREGPVFRKADGNIRLTPRLTREILARRAARAGVPHMSPHTLRHTCASHMLRHGAYLFNVQDLLGHAHAPTTAVYLHRMPVDRSAAADYRATHPRA